MTKGTYDKKTQKLLNPQVLSSGFVKIMTSSGKIQHKGLHRSLDIFPSNTLLDINWVKMV